MSYRTQNYELFIRMFVISDPFYRCELYKYFFILVEPELLAFLKKYEARHIPDKLRTAPTSAAEAAAK